MFKAILLQIVIVLLASLLVMPWLDWIGAVSVLLGGMAYALPNLLFVMRLRVASAAGKANAVTFFVGQLMKVLASIALLVAAQQWFDVHWLALLLGLFVALKANLFSFLLKT